MACAASFVAGLAYCFESGFRSLTTINQFGTVLSTTLSLVFDVMIFYYSGHFARQVARLSGLTGESVHWLVDFCLRYLVIPLMLVILGSWLWDVPSFLARSVRSHNYLGVGMGILYNLAFVFAFSYYYFREKGGDCGEEVAHGSGGSRYTSE